MFFRKNKKNVNTEKTAVSIINDNKITTHSTLQEITAYAEKHPEISDLQKTLDKVELENTNLKIEISYYERYIKYLKDNYIFILKSLDCAKDIYDKIGEAQNEELD